MAQRRRHLLAARAVIVLRRLGQQQAGFQIRQPSRHHEIIGRDFEAQLPRCRDEREILLGERQDRDLGQVDLLLAREAQQQIDRPLEPVEIENQRRLAGLGRLAGFGRCRLRHPPCPVIASTKPISASAGTPISQPRILIPNPPRAAAIGEHEQQHQDQHAVGFEPRQRPRQKIRQHPDRHPAAVERRQRQHVEDAQHRVDLQRIHQIAGEPFRGPGRGHGERVEQQRRDDREQHVGSRPSQRDQDRVAPRMVQTREIDRHRLRIAEQKPRCHEQQRRQDDRAERVDVFQRVECDPALAPSRVVAEPARDKAVRRLMERYREDDREDPGRRLPQHARPVRRGVHADPLVLRPSRPPSARQSAARPRAQSKSCAPASGATASARATRACACGDSGRAAAAISSISAMSPLQCSTRSQPASSARSGALGETAGERAHRDIVRDQDAVEADFAADHAVDHDPRQRRRRRIVDRGVDDMRGHRPGHVGQRAERREICLSPASARLVIDPRQRLVAVDARAAVPRDMLDDRQYAAGQQTRRRRRGRARATRAGSVPQARSPMTGSAPGAGRSSTGAASTVMPSSARSSAISRADEPRRFERDRVGQRRDFRRGRIGAPFRRAQARDPAALLVDQHRRVRPPDRLAQLIDQGADLIAAARNCAGTARSRADRSRRKTAVPPGSDARRQRRG